MKPKRDPGDLRALYEAQGVTPGPIMRAILDALDRGDQNAIDRLAPKLRTSYERRPYFVFIDDKYRGIVLSDDPHNAADEAEISEGEYDVSRGTVWVYIRVESVFDPEDRGATMTALDPPEPECFSPEGHQWHATAHWLVGGSYASRNVCLRCGAIFSYDDAAYDLRTGVHSLNAVRYKPPDAESLALAASHLAQVACDQGWITEDAVHDALGCYPGEINADTVEELIDVADQKHVEALLDVLSHPRPQLSSLAHIAASRLDAVVAALDKPDA